MFLLSELTDHQKSLLTRLAYLNIDFNRFNKIKEARKKITISDLKEMISNPNELYIGSLHMPILKKRVTHIDTTSIEFIEEIENAGLGGFEIIDYIDDKEKGFNALCFKDEGRNIGFSFRGTDLKTFSSFVADGIADIEAYLTNNTAQIEKADKLFNRYKNTLGRNYIYGHSLGGFLAENVYLRNYKDIANVFIVNPLHINGDLLDTKEKVNAFNDRKKFTCFVIGGDYISFINIPDLFSENVHYVKNSGKTANNPFGNHMIEAGKLDENGNFIEMEKNDAFEGHTVDGLKDVIHFIQEESVKGFMSNTLFKIKKYMKLFKRYLNKLFKRREKNIADIENNITVKNSSGFDEYINPNNYPKNNINRYDNKVIRKKREEKDIDYTR